MIIPMTLRGRLHPLVAAVMLLAGCAHTDPARFYTLSATAQRPSSGQVAARPSVIVAPVQVAAYLDRPQVIARLGESELQLAEFDRWAEPLADGISRVLAENLSRLLPSQSISDRQPTGPEHVDFRVSVSVTRFDQAGGKEVLLRAHWSVFGGNGKDLIAHRLSAVQVAIEGKDVASAVYAQSRALGKLSEEIAAVIKAAPAGGGAG